MPCLSCVALALACSRPSPERASPSASSAANGPAVLASALARPLAPLEQRRKVAELAASAPRPDLGAVKTPALAAALAEPEALWSLLTAPTTSYLERRAAAAQGRGVFPLAYLPRLTAALAQLRAEAAQHEWGLAPHPQSARPAPSSAPPERGSRVASVLGRPWTVPEHLTDYPLTWEEEAAAPWPWQAQQALEQLFAALFPRTAAEARPWLEACVALPWSTDAEARMLVEASRGATHVKSTRVMARWRAIALTEKLPEASLAVAQAVGEATRLWDAPESQAIGEVLTVDMLTRSPHARAREHAAFGIKSLGRRWREGKERTLPPPSTAILTALRMANDPLLADAWTRLTAYGFGALEAMPSPPFVPDRRIDPSGPEVAARAAELASWTAANLPRLEAEATERNKVLDPARGALEAAERESRGR